MKVEARKNGENNINNWVVVVLYAKKKTIAKHLNYLLLIKRMKNTNDVHSLIGKNRAEEEKNMHSKSGNRSSEKKNIHTNTVFTHIIFFSLLHFKEF